MGEMQSAPLGEPNESYMDLPAAWRAAMMLCPHCRGRAVLENDEPCLHCEETGDLLGAMLKDAYLRGRDHVVSRMRELDEARKGQVQRVLSEEPSQAQLRSAMGLGPRMRP